MSEKQYRLSLFLCLMATFLSGVSGLVYEIVWQKLLANVVGSGAGSHAIILAVFLGGLGIGYLISGWCTRYMRSIRSLLLALCGIEIMIGVWGISIPQLYLSILANLDALFLLPVSAFLVNLLVCIVCLGIPAVCMGATLPLLTQSFSNTDESRAHSYFYSVNTGGAFIGALGASLFILPSLNLIFSSMLAGCLNLCCAVLFGVVYFSTSREAACYELSTSRSSEEQGTSLGTGVLVAFLLGVITMTFQTITFRHVGIAIGASEYVFGITVASFILLIAIGAYWCAGRKTVVSPGAITLVLFAGLLGSYFIYPYWPYCFHVLRVSFGVQAISFYGFHLAVFLLLSVLISVPVIAMGGCLPALFWSVSPRDREEGYATGLLYGGNTLGSIVGALCVGYYALHFVNIDVLFKGLLVSSFVLYALLQRPSPYLVIAALGAFLLPGWDASMRGIGLFHERVALEKTFAGPHALYGSLLSDANILSVEDGPITTATVVEFRESSTPNSSYSRTLMVNGKSDGNTSGDRVTMRLLGHLPGLLGTGEDRRAAVIGFGTGMTLGSLGLYTDVHEIDLVEISPAVLDQAPYFDFANHSVSQNEKITWHVDDAYHFFLHAKETFDIVVVQPSNPWLAGLERLYSEEFYELVSRRMSSTGVLTQWISLWGLSPETVRLMLTTVHNEFPHVRLFEFKGSLLILASKQQMRMPAAFSKRYATSAIRKELDEIGITEPEVLLSLERWMPPRSYRGQEYQTLAHPTLGYRAARDFFQDASVQLESLVPTPSDWKWSRAYADTSFLATWLQSNEGSIAYDRIIEASCGGSDVSLVEPAWRYTRSPCRDALLASYVRGNRSIPDSLQSEIHWLKTFVQQPTSMRGGETPHAALFAQFDSVFTKLSEQALMSMYSSCLGNPSTEGVRCQEELLKILTFTNRLPEVQTMLARSPSLEGSEELMQYVEEVRQLTGMTSPQ